MKNGKPINRNLTVKVALACAAIGWMCWGTVNFCNAQTQPANSSSLSPDLQEVVTLSRQQMGDDVITNYIKSTGKIYNLSADDIIYLKNQGVSQGVISALLQTASTASSPQSPGIPPTTSPPQLPPPTITDSGGGASITSVAISGGLNNYTLTINGTGFGSSPGSVPFTGVTPYFRLFEVAQLGAGEWGYPGDANTLNYQSWSDTQIQISGFAARPGDAIQIWVSNPATGSSATWGGNVPGGVGNPQITSVNFSGSGANLQVQINGFGFGDAPTAMPFTGDLNQFLFADQRTHSSAGSFNAGGSLWGVRSPTPVTVTFQSWSDNQIVINGFAGAYGQGDINTIQEGDPIYIVVWNSSDVSKTGPQTAWGGFVSANPSAPTIAQATPSVEVNFDYFHNQLAPYGTWVQVEVDGNACWCWQPTQAIAADPNWRPYYDMGQWAYTDNGWFWQSDYTWGDIPFHYGNWIIAPGYGWVWVPGYTWGPAWVFWRQAEADGCIGWAPLPPGAVFINGGWEFHGRHYGIDFDFGLGEGYFAFIGFDHFHDDFFRMRGREYAFHVPRERIHAFYGRSVLRNDFRRDEHGRLINDGIGRDRIEQLTHHREEVMHFEERNPVGNREKLAAQRIEEAHKRVAPQIGKPGEPGHEQFGKPVEQPAPVNKVFRPPTSSQNTPRTAPQRQTQVPQQKQPEKKQ